jgi:predicted RNase H-like HicB family nuclease
MAGLDPAIHAELGFGRRPGRTLQASIQHGYAGQARAYDDAKRAEQLRCAVLIEKADRNFSAYVPDPPGCVATGTALVSVENEIREAIRFHIEGLKADGLPVPALTSMRGSLCSGLRSERRFTNELFPRSK